MGRGETVYCWGEHWLSVMCWCLLDGTNEVCKSCWSEDGCLGCMTGSGCVGSILEDDDVVCSIRLELAIVVIQVVVVVT